MNAVWEPTRHGRRPTSVSSLRVLSVFAVLGVATLAGPTLAAADCGGPSYAYSSGRVDRGATVRITGTAWGDSCYDTGAPPPGQGVLGIPQRGIEIGFVQDGVPVVVTQVAADASYRFAVDITVPASLHPGAARLFARKHGTHGAGDLRRLVLQISDAPAPAPAPARTPEIAPGARRGASVRTSDGVLRRNRWLWGGAGVVVALGAVAIGVSRLRRVQAEAAAGSASPVGSRTTVALPTPA